MTFNKTISKVDSNHLEFNAYQKEKKKFLFKKKKNSRIEIDISALFAAGAHHQHRKNYINPHETQIQSQIYDYNCLLLNSMFSD